MVIFAIASEVAGPHSMGGSPREWHIRKEGAYDTGDFPPAFTDREAAQRYLDETPDNWTKRRIVEMELR